MFAGKYHAEAWQSLLFGVYNQVLQFDSDRSSDLFHDRDSTNLRYPTQQLPATVLNSQVKMDSQPSMRPINGLTTSASCAFDMVAIVA